MIGEFVAMRPTDRPYVVSTWGGSSAYPCRRRDAYRVADRIIDGGANVVCMVRGNAVHAWCAASGGVLHYAYVPPELRRNGFARSVITEALGGYPDRITTSHRWPFRSRRFRHEREALVSLLLEAR